MRTKLFATASILALSLGSTAFAAMAVDAAYDKSSNPIVDSKGNCVRTKFQGDQDPCAPVAPTPKPVAIVQPRAAVMPSVSLQQRTVYFDFNKSTLTASATAKLDQLAGIINRSNAITDVVIHGFTDQIGTSSYNEALAHNRAAAVKSYLDSKSRLKSTEGDVRGLGKSAPEAQCAAIKKRAAKIDCMNKERRVEIEFKAQ